MNAAQSNELMRCADANLYESRQHGGDTVTCSPVPATDRPYPKSRGRQEAKGELRGLQARSRTQSW